MADFSIVPLTPLQLVSLEGAAAPGVELAELRLELVGPLMSGNKSYKLTGYWQVT